jgi:hypothetical protein
MKSVSRFVAGIILMIVSVAAHAADRETCRGGYIMMLMTPSECSIYLNKLKDAQARSDKMALLELREWHTALLIQRAETCPCLRADPVVIDRTAASDFH